MENSPAADGGWILRRRDEALAASAPGLLGLGFAAFGLGAWMLPRSSWFTALALLLAMAAALVGAAVVVAKRLPDWGLTWAGNGAYAFFLAAFGFVFDLLPASARSGGRMAVYTVGILAFVLLIGLSARRGWRRAGLLSFGLAPFPVLLQCSMFATLREPRLTLLALPVGLALSGLLVVYNRGPDGRRALSLVVTVVLLLGVGLVYDHFMDIWHAEYGEPGSSFVATFSQLIALVVSAPLLALLVSGLRRRGPRIGTYLRRRMAKTQLA